MTGPSRTVFLFPGMGAQYYQMGKELFEREPGFRRWVQHYDQRAAALTGGSVVDMVFDPERGPGDDFSDLKHGAAALLVFENALARFLTDRGLVPDLLVGASLGESAAGIFAGALEFETMLRVFFAHTDAIGETCEPARLVGMFCTQSDIDADPYLSDTVSVAASNFPGFLVGAVREKDLHEAVGLLESRGVVCQVLPVGQGFHSSLVDPAEQRCRAALAVVRAGPARVPVLSCASVGFVGAFDSDHLWRVLREPIRFSETILSLEQGGPCLYVDVGPSGTLASYVRQLLGPDAGERVFSVLNMYGRDIRSLDRLLDATRALRQVDIGAAEGPPIHREAIAPSRSSQHDVGSEGPPGAVRRGAKESASMNVIMFPGQGAQRRGMGRELFHTFPVETARASEILGWNVESLCLDDPGGGLGLTQFTQPALFVVQALSWLKRRQTWPDPDASLGHSLGEYSALFAAGVFDFETGIEIVKRRGELMAQASGGGMAAVVDFDSARVAPLLERHGHGEIDVANYNSPRQVVIAGPIAALDRAEHSLTEAGARVVRLPVNAAFHSRYMEPVRSAYADFLSRFEFRRPRFSVVANVDARFYESRDVAALLSAQLRNPVRWGDSVTMLFGRGQPEFEELGPVKVLTRIVEEIRRTLPLPTPPVETVSVHEHPGEQAADVVPGPGAGLGSPSFRAAHRVRYACYATAIPGGVSGVPLVRRLAHAGLLGTLSLPDSDDAGAQRLIEELRQGLPSDAPFLVELWAGDGEMDRVSLLLRLGIEAVEATGHEILTPSLVRFRLSGARMGPDGAPHVPRRILVRTANLEVAQSVLSSPPEAIVAALVEQGWLSAEEAAVAPFTTVASDLCARADGAAAAAGLSPLTLLPALLCLRSRSGRSSHVRVGLAGGLGTPVAVAAAFHMGADFVGIGTLIQCTVEASTSDLVKDMLQEAAINDTALIPDRRWFEAGVRDQVLKRGLFFPARANKLWDHYRNAHTSTSGQEPGYLGLLERCFERPPAVVWEEIRARIPAMGRAAVARPSDRAAHYLRRYLNACAEDAQAGNPSRKTQFNIPCSSAMGAYNAWVAKTPQASWRRRHVDEVARGLLDEAVRLLPGPLHHILPEPTTHIQNA